MNKTSTWKHLAGVVALACGLAGTAAAQQAPAITPATAPAPTPTTADLSYGLLGQNYTGIRFSYDHHMDAPPRALRRYGFVSNAAYLHGIDTAFSYDYRDGSSAGVNYQWHDIGATFTGYLADLGAARPFVSVTPGWRWQKIAGARDNGFAYVGGTGVEVALARGLAVAPYVNYQAAPHLHQHGWLYGTNGTYRLNREWSALLGAEMDEGRNLNYTLGMNRHF